MKVSEQLQLLKSSKHFHGIWYRETYPEVVRLNIDPALHYLRYGAAMGRNPGKNFDTRFYLRSYPDVAENGMNPLLHYILHGHAKGYVTLPPRSPGVKHVEMARTKLLSLGFTERPLQELTHIQTNAEDSEARAWAARELALWHMRLKTPEGYRSALVHLADARADAPDLDFRRKLSVTELLCHYFLGSETEGRACYERAALAGEISPDLVLGLANFEPTPEARVALMNRVLQRYNIPPITLLPDETLSPYDRLTSAAPMRAVSDGPKVTVLIAAYNAPTTLPTALRSLQEQTWKNLEIIVIDDCSPSSETIEVAEVFAAQDSRIRVIRMERNRGAYVARNHGLDEATGEYVTLHDADDWSHPKKIETQVNYLIENTQLVGCLSEQARVLSDLTYERWAGYGGFIITNTSSFMFHKQKMKEGAGYWDTVRFSADNELIRRIRQIYGSDAVKFIPSGPLSFQRDSSTSIIADAVMGVNGFFFGARKEYLNAQTHFRKFYPTLLSYPNAYTKRPFPAPILMLPNRNQTAEAERQLDVVIAADLRDGSESLDAVLSEIEKLQKRNAKVGIFELNIYYDPTSLSVPSEMSRKARETIWKTHTRILTFGEEVDCDQLILWNPATLQEHQRYLPKVQPDSVSIVVDDLSNLSSFTSSPLRYAISRANDMAYNYFNREPVWRPIGPKVRAQLAAATEGLKLKVLDEEGVGMTKYSEEPADYMKTSSSEVVLPDKLYHVNFAR